MHLYEDQFSEQHDFPLREEKPDKLLVLASTSRCGSHMLGHTLHRTGCFGFPLEYTGGGNLVEWKKRLGVDTLEEVLKALQRRRTSPNGVFSIKVHYAHLKVYGSFETLKRLLPDASFVQIRRNSVLRQAISWSIAAQTGVFIKGQKPIRDNPEYSFSDILRRLRSIVLDTASWRYVLAAHGCRYLEVEYESVSRGVPGTVTAIAEFIGIELPDGCVPSQPATTQQSDTRNDQWERRWLDEYSGQPLLPSSPKNPLPPASRIWRRLRLLG